MKITSIIDKPIISRDENLLGIENYAKALSEFVVESATPLTIGMQGEWGTGKTSLMNLIKEDLEDKDVISAWINTWEYAMFRHPKEIAPAILKALLENLRLECVERKNWPEELTKKFEKVSGFMKNLGRFVLDASVKKVSGKDGFTDSMGDPQSTHSIDRVEIAEIKREIRNIINILVNDANNPYKKVIFFIDDLDRIEPAVAVEILESLKNIFDVDNCVFILAIDYEVVVKGLERKFGKKTEKNEREFRSFFDKIIQVPFSMPTGAYKIDSLLIKKFEELGLDINNEFLQDYVNIVKLTVGYVPRSVKRFINSYSLTKKIRLLNDDDRENDKYEDLCLFTMLGIQISYPIVFRLLNKKFDYINWDKKFAKEINVDEISVPDDDDELMDEEWEKILWSYCQREPFLKNRALMILEVMNLLRDRLSGNLISILESTMEFASMTSVDDSVESKQVRTKFKAPEGMTVSDLVYNKAKEMTERGQEVIQSSALHKELLRDFPDMNSSTVYAKLVAYSTNHNSRDRYSRDKGKEDCDWFEYLGRGRGFKFIG